MTGTNAPLTVVETATELHVSPHTVRAWISQRRLGHIRLGRAIRVPRTEIARLLETGYRPAKRER